MTRVMPPVHLLAALVLTIAVHFLVPLPVPIPFAWSTGTLLNIAADRQFKRAGTTVRPSQRSSTLVTDGVFRWSCNPMYLGTVFIVVRVALIEGSISSWTVVGAFVIVLGPVFIVREENMLKETSGEAFEGYSQRVQSWLGAHGRLTEKLRRSPRRFPVCTIRSKTVSGALDP